MFLRHLPRLNAEARLILASGSPRRKALLEAVGLTNVRVVVSDFAEDFDKASYSGPGAYCAATARAKGESVLEQLTDGNDGCAPGPVDLLIAADTVVAAAPADGSDSRGGVADVIIEKAATADGAAALLRRLAGRAHDVHTAVILWARCRVPDRGDADGDSVVTFHGHRYVRHEFVVTTIVRVSPLDEADIAAYVAHDSAWRGKAGAYGIQDLAACFIEGIDGDYANVVGLPMCAVGRAIAMLIERGCVLPPCG